MFLKCREIATLLNVHRDTVKRWAKNGQMPQPVRFSERAVRWRAADIREWMENLQQEGADNQ